MSNSIDYNAKATLISRPKKTGYSAQPGEHSDLTVAEAIRHLIELPENDPTHEAFILYGSPEQQISRDDAVKIAKREDFPKD
jgi:hypothetical protein